MKNIRILVDNMIITYNEITDTLEIMKESSLLNGDPDNIVLPMDDTASSVFGELDIGKE